MKNNPLTAELSSLMKDIDKNSEGLDKKILLHALQLTEEDFSNPMTAAEMLEELKKLGAM